MIITSSDEFIGKIVKVVLVPNEMADYFVGKLNAVEENGILLSYDDEDDGSDVNLFIRNTKIVYILHQPGLE